MMNRDIADRAQTLTNCAWIDLRDMELGLHLGTYSGDAVPARRHLLDLSLAVAADRVLVAVDDMALVYDYDPLVAQIMRLDDGRRYQTQEYVLTQIVALVVADGWIIACDMFLRKLPGPAGSGSAGLRLHLTADGLAKLRSQAQV